MAKPAYPSIIDLLHTIIRSMPAARAVFAVALLSGLSSSWSWSCTARKDCDYPTCNDKHKFQCSGGVCKYAVGRYELVDCADPPHCAPGYHSPGGREEAERCKPCPAGTFSRSPGSTTCSLCGAGTTSPDGAISCIPAASVPEDTCIDSTQTMQIAATINEQDQGMIQSLVRSQSDLEAKLEVLQQQLDALSAKLSTQSPGKNAIPNPSAIAVAVEELQKQVLGLGAEVEGVQTRVAHIQKTIQQHQLSREGVSKIDTKKSRPRSKIVFL